MKKNIVYVIIILLNTLIQNLNAQCIFPEEFDVLTGNTGSNMTLLFQMLTMMMVL